MLLHDNKIDILALNETKLEETISKCHTEIDGYNHERYDRNRHGGGVCIYLKSSINYEVVDVASHQDGLEIISLEIKPKCAKSFILIAWYRPPKHDISSIYKIKDVCQALDIRQKEIIILGDTNCDDLPDEDKNTVIKNLRAFYREFQMKQLIRNSTRVTSRSNTLLDHFATNTPKFIAISGVKTIGFSDHDLIYGMRKISSKVK